MSTLKMSHMQVTCHLLKTIHILFRQVEGWVNILMILKDGAHYLVAVAVRSEGVMAKEESNLIPGEEKV